MSNALQVRDQSEAELLPVLQSSLYPGASEGSIRMVLGYCRAANLDPMQKPVHIVPIWDPKAGQMRDVIMPGVGLYRTQAARSGCAGVSEPEFGPDVTETLGGQEITFPSWCRVTVKRRLETGDIAEFTAKELWKENYAVRGGKEKSIAPNAMWTKRPYGQLAKCAEAQALRKAFPEVGAQPTADEVDAESFQGHSIDATTGEITGGSQNLQPARREPAKEAPQQRQRGQDVEDAKVREPEQKQPSGGEQGEVATISAGQVKYLEGKIASIGLDAAAQEQMLKRLGIAAIDTTMTADQFAVLRSELVKVA